MEAVLQRSWEDYYSYELSKRKQFSYPPFCFIAVFKISKKSSASAEAEAIKVFEKISTIQGIALLGPSPSFYEKSNDVFTWQIIVKSNKHSKLVEAAKLLPSGWLADIDPVSLL
jgi:primosomal protein N' (replication factor Y)